MTFVAEPSREPIDRTGGNRIWRIDTPAGPAVQKLYRERRGHLRGLCTRVLERALRRKSSSAPRSRCETERRLLSLWAEAGIDVPAPIASGHSALHGGDQLLLEFVDGATLASLLAGAELRRLQRDELLTRFAATWCHRHRLALQTGDARFVHEHGSFQHVLVAGERLVTIDLERAFRQRRILPLVSKEIAGYLRSLFKRVDLETYRWDVAMLARGYGATRILAAAVNEYLHNPSRVRRWIWAADRLRHTLRRGVAPKYQALEVLEQVLRDRHPEAFAKRRPRPRRATGSPMRGSDPSPARSA